MPEGGREKVDNPSGRLSATTAGLPNVEDELPYKRKAWLSYPHLRDRALASTREKDMMWQAKR
jgi:hypothetical protein